MKVATAATIDEANRRMVEIAADESLGDGYIREGRTGLHGRPKWTVTRHKIYRRAQWRCAPAIAN
jgi:hypothetical protein